MVEIDVWADARCPWCWIGSRRLQAAIATADVDVLVRRSFLLEPDGPAMSGLPMADVAVNEWGLTSEQWKNKSSVIRSEGEAEGLEINVDTALTFDSTLTHRVLKLAAAENPGKSGAAWEAAFDAHFRRNLNLGDPSVLTDLAVSLGLESRSVQKVLDSEVFTGEVLADIQEAQRLRVTSVPTVIAADGRRLSGSVSVDALRQFLAMEAKN